MKDATFEHPKTIQLAERLGIPVYATLGLLACLWRFTGRYALQGDIGRWSNEAIAAAIPGWQGDPGELIAALADIGWLDSSDRHRLIVHDWSEHAEDFYQAKLARACLFFADGRAPRRPLRQLNSRERAKIEEFYRKNPGSTGRPLDRPVAVHRLSSGASAYATPRRASASAQQGSVLETNVPHETVLAVENSSRGGVTERLGELLASRHNGTNGTRIENPLITPLARAIFDAWRVLSDSYDLRPAEVNAEKDPGFYDNFVAMMRAHPDVHEWLYTFEQIPKMPTCLGEGSPPPGHTEPWKISLQWLVANEDNFRRVHRRRWGD
jgi:hypothetical protein